LTAVAARTSRGVIVLGMHRSGTSATTRAINMLGVPLCKGEDLWLDLPGNPSGYWESSSLSRFNEELLRAIGSAWWCPPRPGEVEQLLGDDAPVSQAHHLFFSLHETQTWVWKDPRTCVTLPFWRGVLDAELSCVLVLRNPLEIAASLAARDEISTRWALALWERYLRSALQALEGLPVLVTEYTDLLDEPDRWLDHARAFLGDRGLETDGEAADVPSFVRAELRHTSYADEDLFAAHDVSGEQQELHVLARSLVGTWDSFVTPPLPGETSSTDGLFESLRWSFPLDRRPSRHAVASLIREMPLETESENTMTTMHATTNGDLTAEWREWLAENLLLQVPPEQLVQALVESGTPEPAAQAAIESVLADPCWRAGAQAAQHLRKLESMLDIHQELDGLDGRPFALERASNLSRRDFLERYYARNRPVLMLGLTDGWPAHTEWTTARLKERLGDVEVEVQTDRESDELYELHSTEHKGVMRFGDYIDRIEQEAAGNDLYLTANNHFFERPETTVLFNDFTMPTEYLDPSAPPGTIFFWFGPGGTVTPLHHDVVNVLFVQVHGRKRFSLVPSLQTHRVYNSIGVYSDIDPSYPDLERYPRFGEATRLDFVVEPGEALFIPVGWWHHVEALDTSVSLSFTNFVFPNSYSWEHPSFDR